METLNKCILNYRQPESAAFIEALGEPERTGKKKMWERPGGCGRRRGREAWRWGGGFRLKENMGGARKEGKRIFLSGGPRVKRLANREGLITLVCVAIPNSSLSSVLRLGGS